MATNVFNFLVGDDSNVVEITSPPTNLVWANHFRYDPITGTLAVFISHMGSTIDSGSYSEEFYLIKQDGSVRTLSISNDLSGYTPLGTAVITTGTFTTPEVREYFNIGFVGLIEDSSGGYITYTIFLLDNNFNVINKYSSISNTPSDTTTASRPRLFPLNLIQTKDGIGSIASAFLLGSGFVFVDYNGDLIIESTTLRGTQIIDFDYRGDLLRIASGTVGDTYTYIDTRHIKLSTFAFNYASINLSTSERVLDGFYDRNNPDTYFYVILGDGNIYKINIPSRSVDSSSSLTFNSGNDPRMAWHNHEYLFIQYSDSTSVDVYTLDSIMSGTPAYIKSIDVGGTTLNASISWGNDLTGYYIKKAHLRTSY